MIVDDRENLRPGWKYSEWERKGVPLRDVREYYAELEIIGALQDETAVVDQGRVSEGEWVAVHGCGGVGLSAVEIGKKMGATVIATAGMPSSATRFISGLIRTRPSTREYSVCRRRWTNGGVIVCTL